MTLRCECSLKKAERLCVHFESFQQTHWRDLLWYLQNRSSQGWVRFRLCNVHNWSGWDGFYCLHKNRVFFFSRFFIIIIHNNYLPVSGINKLWETGFSSLSHRRLLERSHKTLSWANKSTGRGDTSSHVEPGDDVYSRVWQMVVSHGQTSGWWNSWHVWHESLL